MAIPLGQGGTAIAQSLNRLEQRLEVATRADSRMIRVAALSLERAIALELSHPGTGIQYGKHRASAPGEPPAVDTGALRNSAGHDLVGGVMRVGVNEPYAAALEYGAPEHNLAPRPFMRPARAQVREELKDVVVGDLRSAVKGF